MNTFGLGRTSGINTFWLGRKLAQIIDGTPFNDAIRFVVTLKRNLHNLVEF